jgi:hypothetical protein
METNKMCEEPKLFQFEMHFRDPCVDSLPFNMQNEQQAIFSDSTDLIKILLKVIVVITKYTVNGDKQDVRRTQTTNIYKKRKISSKDVPHPSSKRP